MEACLRACGLGKSEGEVSWSSAGGSGKAAADRFEGSAEEESWKREMFYRTVFNGYAVKFSPFDEGKIAVATSQNFGIVGNGKQYVLQMGPQGMVEVAQFDTLDGLYDCAWSEENENLLVSACGDGSVKVWDLARPPQANPLRSFKEHTHEVYGVNWNMVQHDKFLSASWDDTIKLWSLAHGQGSLQTYVGHSYCVYSAVWSPKHGDTFLSASGDCTAKVWDIRQPRPSLSIAAHQFEVLTADWNKYQDTVIATGSVDKEIRVWDIRNPGQPMNTLRGHQYAVRRVQWSPHHQTLLASSSYDMSVCLWDSAAPASDALLNRFDHHTEFAVGLDWSMFVEGLLASTGWDEMVYVWHRGSDPRA